VGYKGGSGDRENLGRSARAAAENRTGLRSRGGRRGETGEVGRLASAVSPAAKSGPHRRARDERQVQPMRFGVAQGQLGTE
jgi:hypothetical protein